MLINETYHIYVNGTFAVLLILLFVVACLAVQIVARKRPYGRKFKIVATCCWLPMWAFLVWRLAFFGQDYERDSPKYVCELSPVQNVTTRTSPISMVVARHREDVDWVLCGEFQTVNIHLYQTEGQHPPFRITHAGVPVTERPNTGNECTAYMKYIVDHYENLPDAVYFMQATPHEHCNWAAAFHEAQQHDFYQFSRSNLGYYVSSGLPAFPPFTGYADSAAPIFQELFDETLGDNTPEYLQSYMNGMFFVRKELIKRHSKGFYQAGYELLTSRRNLEAASWATKGNGFVECGIFERLWARIFTGETLYQPYDPQVC
eukprot:TRINITY_DN10707_c0_g1_i1.p1 TRINITY_DN10707_c0_g1~~TRINITY_DN10707_c0_g1_i1.p1  ORF type:complete len:317 (+),score=19.77 TRINITY_DN10707_c0_g1_i1:64-1014(+)